MILRCLQYIIVKKFNYFRKFSITLEKFKNRNNRIQNKQVKYNVVWWEENFELYEYINTIIEISR